MIDSGADISILKQHALIDLNDINIYDNVFISGISSKHVKTIGSTIKNFSVQDNDFAHKFFIVDDKITIDFDGILGNDFFVNRKAKIDYKENTLEFIIENIQFIIPFFETRSVNSIRKESGSGVNGDKGPVEVKNPIRKDSQEDYNNRFSHQRENEPCQFLRPAGSRTDSHVFKRKYDGEIFSFKDTSDETTMFTEKSADTYDKISKIETENTMEEIKKDLKNNEIIPGRKCTEDKGREIKRDDIIIYTKSNKVKIIPGSTYPEDGKKDKKDKKETISKIITENKYADKIEKQTQRIKKIKKIVPKQNTAESNRPEKEKKDIKEIEFENLTEEIRSTENNLKRQETIKTIEEKNGKKDIYKDQLQCFDILYEKDGKEITENRVINFMREKYDDEIEESGKQELKKDDEVTYDKKREDELLKKNKDGSFRYT
jgi:hypothetical protein